MPDAADTEVLPALADEERTGIDTRTWLGLIAIVCATVNAIALMRRPIDDPSDAYALLSATALAVPALGWLLAVGAQRSLLSGAGIILNGMLLMGMFGYLLGRN
jgi:hypothetical protein